jgi:LPXTG-motif cell wall-anchored protein
VDPSPSIRAGFVIAGLVILAAALWIAKSRKVEEIV